jgi:hypothetical protein
MHWVNVVALTSADERVAIFNAHPALWGSRHTGRPPILEMAARDRRQASASRVFGRESTCDRSCSACRKPRQSARGFPGGHDPDLWLRCAIVALLHLGALINGALYLLYSDRHAILPRSPPERADWRSIGRIVVIAALRIH